MRQMEVCTLLLSSDCFLWQSRELLPSNSTQPFIRSFSDSQLSSPTTSYNQHSRTNHVNTINTHSIYVVTEQEIGKRKFNSLTTFDSGKQLILAPSKTENTQLLVTTAVKEIQPQRRELFCIALRRSQHQLLLSIPCIYLSRPFCDLS